MKHAGIFQTLVSAAAAFCMSVAGISPVPVSAGDGEPNAPSHTKTITSNGDGTYTLALNVRGESESAAARANVAVILDTSGSMTNHVTFDSTRIDIAKDAVQNLADELFSRNTDEQPDTIEMGLVTFNNSAYENLIQATTSQETFDSVLNNVSAINGTGTNWEDGLNAGQSIQFSDNDPTYVIFVSDGNPTRYIDENGYMAGDGKETDETISKSYEEAKPEARAIVDNGWEFYSVGVFGNVDRMQGLTNYAYNEEVSGHYFAAENAAELTAALSAILNEINTSGYRDVVIRDGTTVKQGLLVIDEDSFQCYRSGGTDENGNVKYGGEGYGTAFDVSGSLVPYVNDDGEVIWDLSSLGMLENDVTYTVTFRVYPSQAAYDHVMNLKNGRETYENLDEEIRKYLTEEYQLYTNTDADVTYKDTRVSAEEETSDYNQVDPVPLEAAELNLRKIWDGGSAEDIPDSITVDVMADDTVKVQELTLSAENAWEASCWIAPGLMTDSETLDQGHTYTAVEQGTDKKWDFTTDGSVHPMLVNGVIGTDYNGTITMTNTRRGSLDIVKHVTEGENIPDSEFTVQVYLDTPNGEAAEYTVRNSSGETAESGSLSDQTSGNITLKKDWTIEFASLPAGTAYTVTEVNIPAGFALSSSLNTSGTIQAKTLSTAEFTNSYNAVTAAVSLTKKVTGYDAAEAYTFKLTRKSGDSDGIFWLDNDGTRHAWNDAGLTVTTSADIQKDSSEIVSFDQLQFVREGTYVFTADEITATDKAGWTYDSSVHDITVNVTKDTDGKLQASVEGEAVFTNSYTPEPAVLSGEDNLAVTKKLTGREWKDGDAFTFTLSAHDDVTKQAVQAGEIVMPEQTIEINADTSDHRASFGDITFKKAGTYTFSIKEEAGDLGGMTYDTTDHLVIIEVTDDGSGTLRAKKSTESADLTIENKYSTSDGKLDGETNLKVTKDLEGREWLEDDTFSFDLAMTGGPEDGAQLPADTHIEITGETPGHAEAFGDITFTRTGTYTFTITEVHHGDTVSGITYDASTKTITVEVTDDGSGKLNVTASGDTNPTFKNTYAPKPVTLEGDSRFYVKKELTGRDWKDSDSFSFTLKADEDYGDAVEMAEPVQLTAASEGEKYYFGMITFTKAGTYTFTIQENGEDHDGLTYDKAVRNLTVKVSEDKVHGILTVDSSELNEDQTLTFTNKYTPEPAVISGTENLTVTKELTGRDWQDDDVFTFTLSGGDETTMSAISSGNIVMPEKTTISIGNTAGHQASFGDITFKKTGTYTFSIKESAGTLGGMTYDTAEHKVTVTVTDDTVGHLLAEVSGDTNPTFRNTYKASEATADIQVTKKLDIPAGLKGPESAAFTFTLSGNDGAPMPENGTVSVTVGSDDPVKTAAFGTITYAQAGTYTYTVEETGEYGGVTNDTADHTVTVKVTDQLNGTLKAEVSYDSEEGLTFVNTYSVGGDVTIQLNGTKELHTVRAEAAEEEETEEENPEAAEPSENPEGETAEPTATPSESGEEVQPTETPESSEAEPAATPEAADEEAEPSETPEETAAPTASAEEIQPADDMTESTAGETAEPTETPAQTDEADGAAPEEAERLGEAVKDLVITQADAEEPEDVPEPVLTDIDVPVGEGEFTFNVYCGNQLLGTGLTAASSEDQPIAGIVFTPIVLTYDDMHALAESGQASMQNGVFTLPLTIQEEEKAGYTQEQGTQTVTVTIKDNGDGTWSAPEYDYGHGQTAEFINSYGVPDISVSLIGTKTLSGRTLTDREFHFTVTALDGAPEPSASEAWNDASGKIDFGSVQFHVTDLGGERTKTFRYKVAETDNEELGITYDEEKTIAVTVSLSEDGTSLSADTSEAAFTFKNTYQASGEAYIELTKTLDSDTAVLQDGMFSFTIEGQDNAPMPVQTEVSNSAEGRISFGPIALTEEDIGNTYYYTVKEVIPEGEKAFVYDNTVINAAVKVEDAGNGRLKAAVTADQNGFVNKDIEPAEIKVSAEKKITGSPGKKDTFRIRMTGSGTDETVTIKGEGSAEFTALKLNRPGTYTYTIREIDDDLPYYTYDETVYTLTVVLEQDEVGSLVVREKTIKDESGSEVSAVIFTNRYDKPNVPDTPDEPDEPDVPVTPDKPEIPETPDEPEEPDEVIPHTDDEEPEKTVTVETTEETVPHTDSKSVGTGVGSREAKWFGVGLAALCAALAAMREKKRHR